MTHDDKCDSSLLLLVAFGCFLLLLESDENKDV